MKKRNTKREKAEELEVIHYKMVNEFVTFARAMEKSGNAAKVADLLGLPLTFPHACSELLREEEKVTEEINKLFSGLKIVE